MKFPESTYLFVVVIKMDDPQYASTGRTGLLATLLAAEGADGRGGAGETGRGFSANPSSRLSRFFSSVMATVALEQGYEGYC